MNQAKLWAGVVLGCLLLCLSTGCYVLFEKVQALQATNESLTKDVERATEANKSLEGQLKVQTLVQQGFAQLAGDISNIRQEVGQKTEVRTNVIREIIKTDNCSQSRVPSGAECVLKPSLCSGG